MKKKSLFGVLVAVALSALGNPGQGAGTVESFGVDFGNAASAAQPGWTNMGVVTTTPSSTLKSVPLRRNNLEASSSPVLAGTAIWPLRLSGGNGQIGSERGKHVL